MPELAIVPILLAAGSAVSEGMQLAGVGQPSAGEAEKKANEQLQKAQQQQAAADSEQRRKAILANLANAQEQAGGALSDTGITNLSSIIAGLPGSGTSAEGQKALSAYLGTPSVGPTATSTGQPQNMVEATYGLSGNQG